MIKIMMALMNSNDQLHLDILEALRSSTTHFLLVDTVGKPENKISGAGRIPPDDVNLVITDVAKGLPRYLPFKPGRFYLVVTDDPRDLEMCLPQEIVFVLRKDLLFMIRYLVPNLEGYLSNRQVLMTIKKLPQDDSDVGTVFGDLPLWQFHSPQVLSA